MMRFVLIVLTLLVLPSAAFAQGRPQNIDVDTIEDVQLGDEGRRVVRFRTEHTGRLRADLFSAPESAGVISFTFREQGAADDADPLPAVVGPGRYEAIVQAVNPGAALVQLNIWLDVPLDEFEPNDSMETALRIDIPFDGIVRLSNGDSDWFRVQPNAGSILGVQLYSGTGSSRQFVAIFDHNGDQIFASDDTPWGTSGMRYARATGRAMYIHLWDLNEWSDSDPSAYKTLNVREYRPEGTPASDNSLVTLSLDDTSSALFQLDLIGGAIGVDTVEANEADAVARELRVAIEGRQSSLWQQVLILLGLIALGVAGYFGWREYAKRKAGAGTAAEAETPAVEPPAVEPPTGESSKDD